MASMQIKPMGNGRCSLYEIGTAPAHTAWLRTSLALRCTWADYQRVLSHASAHHTRAHLSLSRCISQERLLK